ncbi:16S rRNA (cytidine(1402)-2'-O)-methyltransferase [Campylobacter sp. FMV-PI01]|uniref:Ribosomal RNA small subunit methyltransferase I n=1 Tax=Campylobacter portucalensis TaxID=2608384 RepID=A0A6L5WFB5_9BACT|nr:16S rRNA (cytidine(1402)-2'-O)-methyltransferase [Campylobacter portucalensis]MSN95700.1 16S rRNA (cytidine(1402)-2'-O)-methyltransferase [Campylobacter portucalensis]
MLYFAPTPIGNLSDVSLHFLDILKECEVLICEDTRVTKKLVLLLKERYNLNLKDILFLSLHSHNEDDFIKNLDIEIFKKTCIYVSDAGMPCISDPGVFLVKFAQRNCIDYEFLSGSNALLLAAAASGLVQKEFTFLGFLPNKGEDRKISIQNAINSPYPVIIYESPKRVLNLVEDISKFDQNRDIFLIKEATKKFETKFFGSVSNVLEILKKSNLSGEWVVVISASKTSGFEKITIDDILNLDLSIKQKSKLIAKITGEKSKNIYKNLLK